jgi:hypothetical protein
MTVARLGSCASITRAAAPSARLPSAAASAARIGSHARGPVHIKAAAGTGTGHHGNVAARAGRAVNGVRRQPGTNHAITNPATPIHQGAGETNRTPAAAADSTVTDPVAHHTATPMHAGPSARENAVRYDAVIRKAF